MRFVAEKGSFVLLGAVNQGTLDVCHIRFLRRARGVRPARRKDAVADKRRRGISV